MNILQVWEIKTAHLRGSSIGLTAYLHDSAVWLCLRSDIGQGWAPYALWVKLWLVQVVKGPNATGWDHVQLTGYDWYPLAANCEQGHDDQQGFICFGISHDHFLSDWFHLRRVQLWSSPYAFLNNQQIAAGFSFSHCLVHGRARALCAKMLQHKGNSPCSSNAHHRYLQSHTLVSTDTKNFDSNLTLSEACH